MLIGIEDVDSAIVTGIEVASFVLVGFVFEIETVVGVEYEIEIVVGVGVGVGAGDGAGTGTVGVQDAVAFDVEVENIEDFDSATVIVGVHDVVVDAAEVGVEVYIYVAGIGVETLTQVQIEPMEQHNC